MFFLPFPPISDFIVLAYLDPGSGSLLIQMLLAALVGSGLLLRSFWSKLFPRRKQDDEDTDIIPEDEEESRS